MGRGKHQHSGMDILSTISPERELTEMTKLLILTSAGEPIEIRAMSEDQRWWTRVQLEATLALLDSVEADRETENEELEETFA
jgi:hypothetical protein